MTKELFDIKYKSKGGVKVLLSMTKQFLPLKVISEHFGVTRESVRNWTRDIFGEKYDPRVGRRELIVKQIMAFLLLGRTIEEAKVEFQNGYYIKLAQKRLKK